MVLGRLSPPSYFVKVTFQGLYPKLREGMPGIYEKSAEIFQNRTERGIITPILERRCVKVNPHNTTPAKLTGNPNKKWRFRRCFVFRMGEFLQVSFCGFSPLICLHIQEATCWKIGPNPEAKQFASENRQRADFKKESSAQLLPHGSLTVRP